VPLEEVKSNFSHYIQGLDGKLELNLLMLAQEEIAPLFTNKVARQLPSPDSRIVTDIKIIEDDDTGHIYLFLNSGRQIALNDDLLVKIIRSEPIASYAEINNKRD
jgi:hypothetical protein